MKNPIRAAHRQPTALAVVALGAMAGAAARYGVAQALPASGLPWATVVVNLVGAFLLGFIAGALTDPRIVPEHGVRLRQLLGTGFCGAFTTYSTFAHDVIGLQHTHDAAFSGLWALAELLAGLMTAFLGAFVASRVSNPGASA